ncbi:conserved hypothetical protein [Microsporum canis CBS 113480]|uniref:Uncharacterized protein n=1 Tax=Arthroderma otae (strain ATCC MYA-4605 / CBS 113480) TaxID=554155 RepID=C5FEG7_ARTOC|nr:conserved hypothetical protein [Microsporum canis CBS 113480]EEQ28201.1 conserved hypothetical protein [Microsporum canis CBS 113480]
MQFANIFITAIAMLTTSAVACKCFVNGNQDNARTESCCGQLSGIFNNGDDCAASSISEHLSNFRSCCGGQSDCDYPLVGDVKESDHIKTIVAI